MNFKTKILFLIILVVFPMVDPPFVYAAASPWLQTNWAGGSGQTSWSDATKFSTSANVNYSTVNQVKLDIISNWYNISWGYRKAITIDQTKVGASLTDYPLLINIASDTSLAAYAKSNGDDILFTSSDGITKLDHEIEKFDNSTGRLVAWVRIPSLSASTPTTIYMYYGNAASVNQQNQGGVWNNSYVGVWHFNESTGNHYDATINNNDSSIITVAQQGADIGKAYGADLYSSSGDYVSIPDSASSTPSNYLTVEAWISLTQTPSQLGVSEAIVQKQHSISPSRSYLLEVESVNNAVCFWWVNSSSSAFTRCGITAGLSVNTWYYIAGTKDATTMKVYLNGSDDSGWSSGNPSGTLFDSDSGLTFAPRGKVDEVRISNTARPAGYFTTVYNNVNSPSTFYSLAVEEAVSGTLTSSIFDTGQASDFGILTLAVATPTNTTATIKVRTGNSPTMVGATNFTSCNSVSSGVDISSNNCVSDQNRYVQYQISLSRTDLTATPTFTSFSLAFSATGAPASTGFIQRVGSNLYLSGQIFKFSGLNVYWLGYDESNFNVYGANDYPTSFMVDDALNAAAELGAKVIRNQSSISVGCAKCIEPSLGIFNDEGFQMLDYAINVAKTKGIYFIFPLVDHQEGYYHGGKKTFTDWRSVTPSSNFYTNSTVIQDYKDYISHFLNHVNPYTGVAYKNEPNIMAWETGNEVNPASAWTQTIADYIKSIDSNHLVIDGKYGIDPNSLGISSVDIYSNHFYPLSNSQLTSDANLINQNNKTYIAGEYDWTGDYGGDTLSSFLSAVESNYVSGDLMWSLFGHKNTYGFTSVGYYNLHYPGDTSGMRTRAQQLRNHAYTMQGISVPSHSTVSAPYLHNVTYVSNGYSLIWRGIANADTYTVERSNDNANTWSVIQAGLRDGDLPWTDSTAAPGNAYSYRIKAIDLDGNAGSYSNTQSAPGNMMQNGSFDYSSTYNGLSFWTLSLTGAAAATVTQDGSVKEDGSYSANISVTNTGGTYYYVQLYQRNLTLVNGKTYNFSFWAKADQAKTVTATLQQVGTWSIFKEQAFNITTGWAKYTFTYTATADESNAQIIFSLAHATGQIWIDNVSFTGPTPPSIPSSLTQYKSDGTTVITSAGWTNEATATLKFNMSSTNNSDSLTPQIEIRPIGTSFTNIPTSTGSAVVYSGSAVTGTVTVTGLSSGTNYHWQAQISNSSGASQWVSKGGNPDFKVDTSSPSSPGTSSTTSPTTASTQYWSWAEATDLISGIANYIWRTTGTAISSGTTTVNSVITSLTEGVYDFFVKAVDNAGNQGAESPAGTVTINNANPTSTPTPTTANTVNSTSNTGNKGDPNPNILSGYTKEVTYGPHYSGKQNPIGDYMAQAIFNSSTHHDDLNISVLRKNIEDLVSLSDPIPLPWSQGLNTASEIYQFQTLAAFNGMPVNKLDNPATIQLKYDPSRLAGRSPKNLRIGYYGKLAKKWFTISQNTVIDPTSNKIANTTKYFNTYFAVVYPSRNAPVYNTTIPNQKSYKKNIPVVNQEISKPVTPASQTSINLPLVRPKTVQDQKRCFLFICW